jgi:uncharacterized membrane protein
MKDVLLALSVFIACAVEATEALTIVLAVGVTRGWRSTWIGVATAAAVLGAVVAVLGPALTAVPINALRLVVGALLLIFGLQWLRKALLRASGFKALHDEQALYVEHAAEAAAAARGERAFIDDWYSFTIAFKGVLLEGLEVAFIVVTFGANQQNVPLAVVGAVAAVVVVTTIGIAVRAPLARVPENTLKFVVGVMLTSFGTFWGAEGAGVHWPGNDVALVGVLAVMATASVALLGWLRRAHAHAGARLIGQST